MWEPLVLVFLSTHTLHPSASSTYCYIKTKIPATNHHAIVTIATAIARAPNIRYLSRTQFSELKQYSI